MIVFKTFLKVLNKNKFIIILYSVILLAFGTISIQSKSSDTNFVASKPSILIVNEDKNEGITKSLINYIEQNSDTPKIDDNESARDDALFYTELNYIIYIPNNFNKDFIEGKNPEIKIKSGNNYNSSYANMILNRYMKVASMYQKSINDEKELVSKIDDTLSKDIGVKIVSKLDTNALSKSTHYFNFESYSILACLIYVICIILSTFNSDKVKKRTIISSTNYKKNNRILLLSNCLYSILIWLFYLIISFIMLDTNIMFSMYGVIYMINSFIFTMCATTIAFLIGNIVQNKNAISGIVNVVALGSSFLCGAFVPLEFLPSSVITLAHLLPTYYYVKSNELLTTIEVFNFNTLKPILINMIILISISIVLIIITNIISNKKQKIG